MTSTTAGRRQVLGLGLLLGLAAAAVGLVWILTGGESLHGDLLARLSEAPVGGGRLFRASSTAYDEDRYKETLVQAGLALLTTPETPLRRRIEALVAAGTGDLAAAAEGLSQLADDSPYDAEVLNDLGVVYMALGPQKASNYFRASKLFERAGRLTLLAPAPAFNTAVLHRQLNLQEMAATPFQAPQPAGEASAGRPSSDLHTLAQMLTGGDAAAATRFVQENISTLRKAATEYLFGSPADGTNEEAVRFIAAYCEKFYSDGTLAAMMAPLNSRHRESVLASRRFVARGIEWYQRGKFDEAGGFYDQAENMSRDAGSAFDDLWIKLNRADHELRRGRSKIAGDFLATVINESRTRGYKWLEGMALAAKGANSNLSPDYEAHLASINESISILTAIAAAGDSGRAIYYLATAYSIAGDFETGLTLAYKGLKVIWPDDRIRRGQFYWLAGQQLYRLGFADDAISLEKMAVAEVEAVENTGLVSFFSSHLTMMQVANRNYAEAERSLTSIKEASAKIQEPQERELNALIVNLLCARIKRETGNLSEAESCLKNNLQILDKQTGNVLDYYAQTRLQLAEVYSQKGQPELARRELRQAAAILEKNDAYLSAIYFRVSFENERRNLYEKAISLEYTHDGEDEAWGYTQGYRSKLFLEFLRQTNPGIDGIHKDAINRSKVQQRIPSNVQVVEYLVLPDRLLIWLVSNEKFLSVSVPVRRAELDRKIAEFLRLIQNKGELEKQAGALHDLLIGPIESQLDPNRALAIIPDQALHRLSFPALYSRAKGSYLIDRYAFLESPSMTSLLLAPSGAPARRTAVAFGAQTDDTNAGLELQRLQKYYDDITTFDGPAAVKPTFLSSLMSADIFHFAGHSQDASDPLRSAVLLDGRAGGPNSVSALDISTRKMPPNSVVVLASCDSSVGNSRDGVGMRGLTSAFLISGAGSVVGSLWLVEADSTSRLVLAFHEGFTQKKLSVAEALREAQRGLIAERAHPYYWAGFVVTGNLSAVR
jgi:CHAT domain-containing protein